MNPLIYDSLNVIKARILNISELQCLTGHIVSSCVQLRLVGSAVPVSLPNRQQSHWGWYLQRFHRVVAKQTVAEAEARCPSVVQAHPAR